MNSMKFLSLEVISNKITFLLKKILVEFLEVNWAFFDEILRQR